MYPQFIDPVNPANSDTRRIIAEAEARHAGTDAVLIQALLGVVALSFVAANFLLLYSFLRWPDTWLQGDILSILLQYGFGVLISTFTIGVIGSAALLAGSWAISSVKQLLHRSRHEAS
jgi:hypothetical protein